MKKWIDASIIAERESVEKELWDYEKLMKEIPNMDKIDNKIKGGKRTCKNGKSKKTFKTY
ncbi:MAG: hypothetical protein RSC84_03215 [Peptostreptococcaceae bacterium]